MSLPIEHDLGPAQGALPTWDDLQVTGRWLATVQEPSGAIPWEAGRHTDPWDHVECVMALSALGFHDEAEAGYRWLARTQRADGTWPMKVVGSRVVDGNWDSNQCAYVAVGVWHHWMVTGDQAFVAEMWPVVARALDAVVELQLPWGGIAWAKGADGPAFSTALLAGSASIWHALQCGVRLAELVVEQGLSMTGSVGLLERRDRWAQAQDRLGVAIREREGDFEEKRRWSMDWYYPILGGAMRGKQAYARLRERWDEFVVPGLGIRCLDDHPWVTGAETCELALAMEALGDKEVARGLVADIQHLREDDGSYHTGYVYTDAKRWPVERSTWTAAAVVLAVDAIEERSGGAGVFRLP